MGYESRMFVVNKSDSLYENKDGKSRRWAEIIAIFNMSCLGDVGRKFRNYPATDCYINNADDEVIADCYGDALKEIPLADAINIITEAAANENYRRFVPFLGLLNGFDPSEWSNLVVLHYGY